MESGFARAASALGIPVGKTKKVSLNGNDFLIVNVEGRYYAVSSLCTHFGGDLSEGSLEGRIITCPNHKAKFDVTTGKVVSPPVETLSYPDIEDLPTYLTKVENLDVFVKL